MIIPQNNPFCKEFSRKFCQKALENADKFGSMLDKRLGGAAEPGCT
jgi:hypothetical protein